MLAPTVRRERGRCQVASPAHLAAGINTVWVLVAGALVFFMEGGFAALEAGLVRQKNTINIMMKVFMDCTVGVIGYWAIGFGLMFGLDRLGIIGINGFFLSSQLKHLGLSVPPAAFWFFQAAFAVAAISIVSGAVAERMKFSAYIVFAFVGTALIYAVSGHWVWDAGGWLNQLGMRDFAGSAVVHAAGGWAALAAVMLLGPRIGKYNRDGTPNVLPANNLPLAAMGAFILWFGWFGFNPGSTLSGLNLNIATIAMNTEMAAAAGGVVSTLYTMRRYGKADPSMTINGVLAGLVAITAGCAYVSAAGAVAIGAVAGWLVVWGVAFFDRLRLDDPVGALAVHGLGGTFGAMAVGLFALKGGLFYGGGLHLLGVQILGTLAVSVWAFSASYGLFALLKRTVGIRVSAHEEMEGLDVGEHGVPAYSHGATSPAFLPNPLHEHPGEALPTPGME